MPIHLLRRLPPTIPHRYDDASCRGSKEGDACGGWNCTAAGECGSFVDGHGGQDGLMQLYDVGMASMHAMDTAALSELAAALGRHDLATKLASEAAAQGRWRSLVHLPPKSEK